MHENVYKTWNVYELMIKIELSSMFHVLNFHIFLRHIKEISRCIGLNFISLITILGKLND